ncbi:MAG: alpha-glucan family phosphorylase [Rikenellaceae bacterium]
METKELLCPDYIFETSWEVCNKVGGIHTVVSTKAQTLTKKFQSHYIVIGPDFNSVAANIEFDEDVNLLKLWKTAAYNEGLRIRIGRWKVKGNPIAVLVDFSSFVPKKDSVLKALWESFKVDSISGQWDYIEPVLFGYAAAKAIECYVSTFCSVNSKVVAHFHEWMTASGGLYLNKEVPSIATVFTTHATVSGRCIAGNGLNLYGDLEKFNSDDIANRFNVQSKHSIEKAAAQSYDCFTTVSEITANECKYLLSAEPDVITPNGFDDSFVFTPKVCEKKRLMSREVMIKVAEVAVGKKFKSDPIIIATSGRYEFRNKGLDEFIDSLGKLNNCDSLKEEILAYILVPGWNHGPRKDLQTYLSTGEFVAEPYVISNVTHYMGDRDNDAIINKLKANNLIGNKDGKVTVMFVPTYLNGQDGIFNMHYYEMLPGFDVTLFPSYYEPWGYTPLESIAFGVPSVTTSLSGFGKWIDIHSEGHKGVEVIERNDSNDNDIKNEIAEVLISFSKLTSAERLELRADAQSLSHTALWSHLIDNYYIAYDVAIQKLKTRMEKSFLNGGENHEQINYIKHQLMKNTPTWARIIIERTVPDKLKKLEDLSRNLWWSWNSEARSLFESIDRELWKDLQRNPIALIDNLTSDRLKELTEDEEFISRLDSVYKKFSDYMKLKENRKGNKIAYFSMEYGLHSSLKIYSGGLGILAGDYLKEASDQNVPLVAVGLLYRYGYFTQKISSNGEQEASYEAQNFYKLPIAPVRDADGHWLSIVLRYPGREVVARVWKCEVGRTDLYLLDTDHDLNQNEDRSITHHLYGGDWENRLKQEIMLGMGGMKLIEALDVKADVFHCNEGHAAFIGISRIEIIINRYGLSFSEAMEIVRSSSLFTTHTPVPAGHDAFPEEMMRQYLSGVPETLKITWEQFINLGKTNPNDPNERFSMSFLACNLSQEVNGVSWLHGEVSKDILGGMWPGYFKEELHIGYVTNGVHFPTWGASSLRKIYNKAFGENFVNCSYDKSVWQNIYKVSDEELWNVRLHLKTKLVNHILERVKDPERHRLGSPQEIVKISERLKPDVLTIGFARRFATYKRAHLLFTDINRLDKIVNNPLRPVQFVFAGKAHPNDKPGQDLIKRIVEVSSLPQFVGKIIFLQNYDMELARRMVQGVDVWMNTPTRPLEASGTSGEKAVMNGVLHFSVLDGWWVEGYKKDAGWCLPQERTYTDQYYQDLLDAEIIYTLLEEEISSAYYDRGKDGISHRWLSFIKKSIADVASNFTTKRMIEDYTERYYNRLADRHHEVVADNFRIARELAAWKRHVSSLWDDSISIVSTHTYDIATDKIIAGAEYNTEVIIDLGRLSTDDIGVELVIAKQVTEGQPVKLGNVIELTLKKVEGKLAYYSTTMSPKLAGSYDVAIRVFAKNKYLQHRMDFALVKWS